MKMFRVVYMTIACAALAAAQDKVTVPLSNPSQPATVKVNLLSGSITVMGGGAAGQIVVESGRRTARRPPRDVPEGMHRIDSNSGFDVEEDHNTVTIGTAGANMGSSVSITVPTNTSLNLNSVNGGKIEVTGVSGELDVNNINGSIELKNVSGAVVASSQNGSVVASLDKVTPNKPMSFTSLNGKVDVTLPADTKAHLRMKSDNGSIYSDFDVKLDANAPKPVVEDQRRDGGKYRIRVDNSVFGTINGGGPEYRFETMNGNILIHKK